MALFFFIFNKTRIKLSCSLTYRSALKLASTAALSTQPQVGISVSSLAGKSVHSASGLSHLYAENWSRVCFELISLLQIILPGIRLSMSRLSAGHEKTPLQCHDSAERSLKGWSIRPRLQGELRPKYSFQNITDGVVGTKSKNAEGQKKSLKVTFGQCVTGSSSPKQSSLCL